MTAWIGVCRSPGVIWRGMMSRRHIGGLMLRSVTFRLSTSASACCFRAAVLTMTASSLAATVGESLPSSPTFGKWLVEPQRLGSCADGYATGDDAGSGPVGRRGGDAGVQTPVALLWQFKGTF